MRRQNQLYYKHATLTVLFCGVSDTVILIIESWWNWDKRTWMGLYSVVDAHLLIKSEWTWWQKLTADAMGKFPLISWNTSIYNILRWVAWTMGQINHWPSVWCSKFYFLFMIPFKILCKNPLNLFSYFLYKITK